MLTINFHKYYRKILSETGLGWLKPAHENSHGNNSLNKKKTLKMFKQTSKSDMKKILRKFAIDLEICGYDSTLEIIKDIIQTTSGEALDSHNKLNKM